MAPIKNLRNIVIASAISFAGCNFSGCNFSEKEYFNDKIGEEQIRLYRAGLDSDVGNVRDLVLEVVKTNGDTIFYGDRTGDLIVDYILTGNLDAPSNNGLTCLCKTKSCWSEIQIKFDSYLENIKEKKPNWNGMN